MPFGKNFKNTALISGAMAVSSVVAGILISYAANVATGGTTVLVLVASFLAVLVAKKVERTKKLEPVRA
jgi:ABC-type Mn2+/Zn2+ transport system permease subunit